MLTGDSAFSDIAFCETPVETVALLGRVLFDVTFRAEVSFQPTYTAQVSFDPGGSKTMFADNDTDFKLIGLARARDFLPVNDAILFGHIVKNLAKAVTGASNDSPIVITSEGHGLTTGQEIFLDEIEGNLAANGSHIVTVIDANTFELDDTTGDGDYLSGGKWWPVVEGATNLPLEYITGTSGNYIGLVPGTVELTADQTYVRFVTCDNYILRWGATPFQVQRRQG